MGAQSKSSQGLRLERPCQIEVCGVVQVVYLKRATVLVLCLVGLSFNPICMGGATGFASLWLCQSFCTCISLVSPSLKGSCTLPWSLDCYTHTELQSIASSLTSDFHTSQRECTHPCA
eukprot:4803010-Amphidinium_carterae.4